MIKYANNSCASPVMTVILITRENIETLLFILSSEQTLLSSNSKEICFIVLNRIRGLERFALSRPLYCNLLDMLGLSTPLRDVNSHHVRDAFHINN